MPPPPLSPVDAADPTPLLGDGPAFPYDAMAAASPSGWLASVRLSPAKNDAASPPAVEHKPKTLVPDTASDTEHQFPSDEHETSSGPRPLNKRRRVTRACDECRRKKIKCCGKQPCTHCSVYSYECTYDKPSNRRRNPAPQYVEALESKLQRAEALLRKFMPDVDLSDPALDPEVQQEFLNRERKRARAQAQEARLRLREEEERQRQLQVQQQQQQQQQQTRVPETSGTAGTAGTAEDEQILSMIETIGHLDLKGDEFNYHGISSGAVFLSKMKEHFHTLLGGESLISYLGRPPRPPAVFSLDTPPPTTPPSSGLPSPQPASTPPPWSPASSLAALPPKEQARRLCYLALSCATCLLRIVHLPSFYEAMDTLYTKTPETLTPADHRALGLLYAVLALGCMCNFTADTANSAANYQEAMEEGLKYHNSARRLLQDIADCRDLTSLQALLFMILFLQATSNVSGCYPILGIALRVALRMGLHRHLPHVHMTPIEIESRRRVFYVIQQMDIYVSALLGCPMFLLEEDIDQPLPTELDDAYITRDGYLTPPAGAPSFAQACNAYTRLLHIMAKVVRHVYPAKGAHVCVAADDDRTHGPNAVRYRISNARIHEIETDLRAWHEQLPNYWRPSADGPEEVIRVRTLLRFAYAHVQMLLYRPFLHYISPRCAAAGKHVPDRYYACAAAGISVSRNSVHIGLELQRQGVTVGSYWFMLYTMFFAMLSLVYYVLENPDKPGSAEIMADAFTGKALIASVAQKSMTADKISATLNSLFDRLPDRVTKHRTAPAPPTRKRSAPGLRAAAALTQKTQPPKPASEPGPSTDAATATPALATPQQLLSLKQQLLQKQQLLHQQQRQQQQQRQVQATAASTVATTPTAVATPPAFLSMRDLLPPEQRTSASNSPASSTPARFPVQLAPPATAAAAAATASAPAPAPADTGRTEDDNTAAAAATMGTTDSLYTLGEMLFPSSDPFAYPCQPLVDFGLQHLTTTSMPGAGAASGGGDGSQTAHAATAGLGGDGRPLAGHDAGEGGGGGSSGGLVYTDPDANTGAASSSSLQDDLQHIEAMRFYAPQGYGDDMEGQLLGPMPAFLLQGSDGLGGPGVFDDTGCLAMTMAQQQQQQPQQPQQPQQQLGHEQAVADATALPLASRDEARFADLFSNGAWGPML